MIGLPAQQVATGPSDPWWKLRAGWIYAALTSGCLADHVAGKEAPYVVQLELIGHLAIPGGHVVAADPYTMDVDTRAFVQTLAADAVDVLVARALVGEGHERVAALVLRVAGPSTIMDWQMATVAGQDLVELEEGGFFGYGVDAGTGSFGSPEAMSVAHRVLGADAGMLLDPVSVALFDDGIGTRSAVVVAVAEGAAPIAACSAGWGDGIYPTWLGVDAVGRVVVAVTDFLLTGDPHAAPQPSIEIDRGPQTTRTSNLLRRLIGR